MIRKWNVFCSLLISLFSFGQTIDRPKLVIGIVVDQMRADYLYRFSDNFGTDGFNKLTKQGFVVKNMHYNYVPTATGPGHASIFTGTTPINHGIVANDWYSRKERKMMYCVEDGNVFLVDSTKDTVGLSIFSRSPKNLQSTTITDVLKLSSYGRSKVIGISLKDRGAILPSGHLANYAFWFNMDSGNFITSSYYAKSLPNWLKYFNKRQLPDSLLNLTWNPQIPIEKYTNSGADDAPDEKIYFGKKKAIFPYGLKKLRQNNNNYALIPQIPFGNDLLTRLAIATISGENMGSGNSTDFLTISYSSTDYVGHNFGIRSKEIEDTYIRLDNNIATLLTYLDKKIGQGNYLVFLTADHGASDNPLFLGESRLPGKFINLNEIKNLLNTKLSEKFGSNEWVIHIDKTQVFLNITDVNHNAVIETASKILGETNGVKQVYNPNIDANPNYGVDSFFKNSYNNKRSGDILFHLEDGWMPKRNYGTTHGTAYNNDTHVPMIWYGHNIDNGNTYKRYTIDNIAPTLSFLLDIPLPSSSNGHPIIEVIR
ncbi:alkaline phosphatase family protein [Croceitalea sp. MTPC9]|uniref:alkaline phosphatase PafA n=1 Tax=unclassified Croceitalea TaxID=2632280 RepID=UPI002B3779AA|nr:alkaline phosphatase family protein [Croceitalea sp. MTPC6]GMN16164.1 alkaline phosphatase family protein [Croceitalea sp. MTPC9]